MTQYYYKLTAFSKKENKIYDTKLEIDRKRIKRLKKLDFFFTKMYSCSITYNLSLLEIVKFLFYKKNDFSNNKIRKSIQSLRLSKFFSNFKLIELRLFNDFILEKARKELNYNFSKNLPNRTQVSYFFENLVDCQNYFKELGGYYNCYINKVEFIEIEYLSKFDNKWISSFKDFYTAKDYKEADEKFLLQQLTINPIYEVFIYW